MQTVLTLTPDSAQLAGEYVPGSLVLIKCNALAGAFTITMPDASGVVDCEFVFIKTDTSSNIVTLDGHNNQTINGSATQTLATFGAVKRLISDGDNFWIT